MKKKKLFFVFGTLALILGFSLSSVPQKVLAAAADYYLKIDGIKGSTGGEPGGAISIQSWSFGASNPTTVGSGSGGLSGGKVSISSFNFMKKMDKSSPQLFQASQTGTPIKSLTFTTRVGKEYLKITLENVLVTSYSLSSGGDRPTESISLNYTKVEFGWPKSI